MTRKTTERLNGNEKGYNGIEAGSIYITSLHNRGERSGGVPQPLPLANRPKNSLSMMRYDIDYQVH